MKNWFFSIMNPHIAQILRKERRHRFLYYALLNILCLFICYFLLHSYLPSPNETSNIDQENFINDVPLQDIMPSTDFHLFWTIWNKNVSKLRARHRLVWDSLFIHHPYATAVVLTTTLNDTMVFLPYRQRGYRIYAVNSSMKYLLAGHWYLGAQSRAFLRHCNRSDPDFSTHLSDYLRTFVLYRYGGTYLDMDMIILQPLPAEEFLGYNQWISDENSTVRHGIPLGLMRFHSGRRMFRDLLEMSFDQKHYNRSCRDYLGSRAYTNYFEEHRTMINVTILPLDRLYPWIGTDPSSIFEQVEVDTPLKLADLSKRSFSIHLSDYRTHQRRIARGSLIDLLLDRYDLGEVRGSIVSSFSLLIHPALYIDTRRKQGRFFGRDVIYLRIGTNRFRWNLSVSVTNGTLVLPTDKPLNDLNQADVNSILHQMVYQSSEMTSIDTLTIELRNDKESIRRSFPILVFHRLVTVLTKTMGTVDRWPVVQRFIASVQKYFPDTPIHIASDSGQPIDRLQFFNTSLFDEAMRNQLIHHVLIHDLPEDSGLSYCRNYLIQQTQTPFLFLADDDFVLEEDSHLDLLLELIYPSSQIDLIAGKIPQDMKIYQDYSGVFLYYNQTIELLNEVPSDAVKDVLFPQQHSLNMTHPCRPVDFVPNVFLGRTEIITSVGWDNQLKLAEHEDFFLRFRQANRTVWTCRYIHVHHAQEPWWKHIERPYYQKRGRVYQYYQIMLKKHHLRRIISFDVTNLDLDDLGKNS